MSGVSIFLFGVLILLLVPLVIAYIIVVSRLIGRLERRHPLKYMTMGSPSLISVNRQRGRYVLASYLLRREFESIDDVEVERHAGRARKLLLAMLILSVVAALCAVLALSGAAQASL